MNDDLASLFAYNRWSNDRFLEVCRTLTPDQYAAEPLPRWSSIRSTMAHIAIATEGWLRVVAGELVDRFPSEADLPTVEDIERLLDRAYEILDDVLPTFTPEVLAASRVFGGAGRSVTLPPWAVLRHLVNHATYHRGQVASKLKRLGVEPPATDLVFWAMQQFPQV